MTRAGLSVAAAPAVDARLETLLAAPQGYELWQAIHLIERHQGRLPRLGAHVSLAFPASDVAELQPGAEAGQPWTLRTPLLALAGGHGPLPLPLTELLLAQRWMHDRSGLDFLDLFHNRFLRLMYRGRQRLHPALAAGTGSPATLVRALHALAPLGAAPAPARPAAGSAAGAVGSVGTGGPAGAARPGQRMADAGAGAWLRHAALLGAAPRSMAQLEQLLRDALGVPVRGRQFVGGWHALDAADTPCLGRAVLGQDAVLGRRAWDAAAGIELALGPLSLPALRRLLPGTPAHARLCRLAARHAPRGLDLSLRLLPKPCAPKALPRLGAARLGWTSWLTSAAAEAPGGAERERAPVRLAARPLP